LVGVGGQETQEIWCDVWCELGEKKEREAEFLLLRCATVLLLPMICGVRKGKVMRAMHELRLIGSRFIDTEMR